MDFVNFDNWGVLLKSVCACKTDWVGNPQPDARPYWKIHHPTRQVIDSTSTQKAMITWKLDVTGASPKRQRPNYGEVLY
jgi:hypothetical protein